MALIKCSECGKKVSTNALACPNCGAPPVIPEPTPKTSSFTLLVTAILVLGFIYLLISPYSDETTSENGKPENTMTAAQSLEKMRKERIDNFYADKTSVISSIENLIKEGNYELALRRAKLYESTNDEEIKALISQIENSDRYREKRLYVEVLKVSGLEYEKNLDMYKELMKLNPQSEVYKEKFNFYQNKILQKEAEQAKRQQEEAERNKRIARFGKPPVASAWDGSYSVVEKYLKRIANNPDSIELRSCTKLYYTEYGWLVGCNYTGANAFGGIIQNTNWFIVVHNQVIIMEDASAYSVNN